MLPTDIEAIKVEDLQQLINDSILERRILEYKQELHINSDNDKKEFLADISSFANSNGGDLIYGIREEDHYPKELIGVEIDDIDEETRRLDSIIRDGIRPRIPNLLIKFIQIHEDKYAIIFRIPKSWLNPHMVTFRNISKFFTRASNGKYQLDVDQIRSAFSLSESKINRIKDFIQTRLSEILSNNSPIPLTKYAKICMHIVPLSSIETPMVDNWRNLEKIPILPLCRSGANRAFIADGFLSYAPIHESEGSNGYVLIFRDGSIEAVSSFLSKWDDDPTLPITLLENEIMGGITKYSNLLRILKIDPPAYIFIHLIGVKGLGAPKSNRFSRIDNLSIRKDLLALPSIELTTYGSDESDLESEYLEKIVKLPFDALANAIGLDHSLRYDEDGRWKRTV